VRACHRLGRIDEHQLSRSDEYLKGINAAASEEAAE